MQMKPPHYHFYNPLQVYDLPHFGWITSHLRIILMQAWGKRQYIYPINLDPKQVFKTPSQ